MSPRAQNNLLIEAGKRAQAEAAVTRSMPNPDRLKQLGVSESEWRSMNPDDRSTLIARVEQQEREAAMSWREKHPGESTAIPYITGAFMGAIPYANRFRAQGTANALSRAATENVAAGRQAFSEGDKMAGRYAFQRATEQQRKNDLATNPTLATGMQRFLTGTKNVGSFVLPPAAGAISSTIPEDIDIGQRAGTPNAQAPWNSLFSEAGAKRALMGAAASELPNIVGKTFPVLRPSIPFPIEDTKAFIKSYRPTVRRLEADEKVRSEAARAKATGRQKVSDQGE
jgi:hypothetical protein